MFDRYSARDIDTLIDSIDTIDDMVQKTETLLDVARNVTKHFRLIKHCLLDAREERHLREKYPQTEDC